MKTSMAKGMKAQQNRDLNCGNATCTCSVCECGISCPKDGCSCGCTCCK